MWCGKIAVGAVNISCMHELHAAADATSCMHLAVSVGNLQDRGHSSHTHPDFVDVPTWSTPTHTQNRLPTSC